MADNVANVDFEDVLTSIRRLVSDEGQSRRVAPPEEATQKLVLTPALRVIPEKDGISEKVESSAVPLHAPTVSRKVRAEQLQSLTALEATIAELEAAVGGTTNEFEPDGSEDEAVLDPPPAMFRSSQARRDPVAPQTVPAQNASQSPDIPAETRITFIAQSAEEQVFDDQQEALAEPPVDRANPAPLQLEPSSIVEEAQSVSPETPAAEVEAEDDVEEVLLDEATLRQMVQAIVREELQGSLGEEITRGIRKLIRREIHDYFDFKDSE